MTEHFDTATLVAITLPYINADPDSLHFAPVRTGKHNRSYWVESDAGRYVLRIAPPDDVPLDTHGKSNGDTRFLFYERLMMRQEPALHELIRAETSMPVAEIVGYDFGHTRIDRDYLLLRALPGTPISEAHRLTKAQRQRALYQVGQYLRQLHALTAPTHLQTANYGYLGEHKPMKPQSTWIEAFHVMWNKLLDDVEACGSYTHSESNLFRDLFDHYREFFDRPVVQLLLHMDIWNQNILVDHDGNVTGIVDFDRALWGDVEIEFAVLDYCGISEPSFWDGYGITRDTSPEAEIRRQFYLLYEVQKYMPISIWRRNDPASAERYKNSCFSLAASLIQAANTTQLSQS